ncbi:MAG: hypothetical protein OER86_08820, partial [Phycisphaerae bacterium]|nr:hypothetical protein [Phycisphaerae bacterium]
GKDRVQSRGGTNTARLGEGDDRFKGGRDDDTVFGEGGDDNIKGSNGDDDLMGGDGDDDINSGRGNDRVRGGSGKDRLRTDRDDDVEDEPEDEFEDHNRDGDRDKATVFGLGIDHAAALKGSIRNFNDEDWFRFTAEADGMLDLTVTSPGGDLVEVEIEDALQNTLDKTDPGSGDNAASLTVSAGLTYFIKIEAEDADDGGSVPADYCVDLVLTPTGAGGGGGEPADVIAEVEPNNPKASATLGALGSNNTVRLTGSSNSSDDRDFFLVPIDADGSLEVMVASTNGILPDIQVEDTSDINRLALEDGATVGTVNVLAGEQLFVRVRAPGDAASDYQVDLTLTPTPA